MARMTKRISTNITRTKEAQNQPTAVKKASKDIWLLILIAINFFLLITMWPSLIEAPTSFATYVLLEIALIIMYVNRHAKLPEETRRLLLAAQVFFMALILVLFLYNAASYIFS